MARRRRTIAGMSDAPQRPSAPPAAAGTGNGDTVVTAGQPAREAKRPSDRELGSKELLARSRRSLGDARRHLDASRRTLDRARGELLG